MSVSSVSDDQPNGGKKYLSQHIVSIFHFVRLFLRENQHAYHKRQFKAITFVFPDKMIASLKVYTNFGISFAS